MKAREIAREINPHEERALTDSCRRAIARCHWGHIDRWHHAMRACDPDHDDADLTTANHATIGLLLFCTGWPEYLLVSPDRRLQLVDRAYGPLGANHPIATREVRR